ncbi:MAG: HupE/UreJ family protein [Acidobacteriota bacterium]
MSFLRSAFLLALLTALPAAAHDIPSDVAVHAFVRPEGKRLQLLLRMPLGAIRDVVFPERGPGYLDVEKLLPQLPDAATVWLAQFIAVYEGEERLPKPRVAAVQVSLPSDRSFASFERALAHVNGPKLGGDSNIEWNQALFDVLLEYPIASDRHAFSIRPGLQHLAARTLVVLRFLPPGGEVRAYEFVGDPGIVPLDPRWYQAAARFVELGFFHILDGTDHLLFLMCLVIPFRRFRPLVGVVTAFTVAHSLTLIASAFNLAPDALWFPPFIETLIAASIVWMALENIAGGSTVQRRWLMAFAFGLVHGFGFSFALRETLQFAGSHLLTSLLSFNAGVELGQLLVLALLIPALNLCFRFVVAERMGTIILSALVAHTGWHWMTERYDHLRQFRFEWPPFDAAWLASVMRGTMWLLILAGLAWGAKRIAKKSGPRRESRPQTEIQEENEASSG